MPKPRNEELWGEIEDLPPFKDGKGPTHDTAWKWLEKLQAGNNLTQLDLMALKAVIENVYSLGKQAVEEELAPPAK